jgi:hypothetical protein
MSSKAPNPSTTGSRSPPTPANFAASGKRQDFRWMRVHALESGGQCGGRPELTRPRLNLRRPARGCPRSAAARCSARGTRRPRPPGEPQRDRTLPVRPAQSRRRRCASRVTPSGMRSAEPRPSRSAQSARTPNSLSAQRAALLGAARQRRRNSRAPREGAYREGR